MVLCDASYLIFFYNISSASDMFLFLELIYIYISTEEKER